MTRSTGRVARLAAGVSTAAPGIVSFGGSVLLMRTAPRSRRGSAHH